MMNLYRRNSGSRSGIATILVLVIVAVDVVSDGKVREVVRVPSSALWQIVAEVPTRIGATGFFSSRRSLAAENAALRRELADLKERSATLSVLAAENEELRSLLAVVEEGQGITAPVLSSTRASPYGTFLVGAGQADSVSYGSIVVTSGGFVIGRVTDVDSRRAVVTELLAPGASVDAVVRKAGISVEGQGGGNGRARVPRGLDIREGDPLTSSVLGGRPIAVVGSVKSDPSSPWSTLFVRLPSPISALRFVYIIPDAD